MKMNKIFMAFVCVMLASYTNRVVASETETLKNSDFTVAMSCQGCADKITSSLNEEAGVKAVKCDVEHNIVSVSYIAEKTSDENIIKALTKKGYRAEKIENGLELKAPAKGSCGGCSGGCKASGESKTCGKAAACPGHN